MEPDVGAQLKRVALSILGQVPSLSQSGHKGAVQILVYERVVDAGQRYAQLRGCVDVWVDARWGQGEAVYQFATLRGFAAGQREQENQSSRCDESGSLLV